MLLDINIRDYTLDILGNRYDEIVIEVLCLTFDRNEIHTVKDLIRIQSMSYFLKHEYIEVWLREIIKNLQYRAEIDYMEECLETNTVDDMLTFKKRPNKKRRMRDLYSVRFMREKTKPYNNRMLDEMLRIIDVMIPELSKEVRNGDC